MSDRTGVFAGDDPFEILQRWMIEAEKNEPSDANAMSLATVDESGMPDVRIVLLKEVADGQLVFFTNYGSNKSRQILSAGKAAVNFHWKTLARQIRCRGVVTKTTDEASDAYYQTRPLGSRIGAWASDQSKPLISRRELVKSVEQRTQELGGNPPRPPHWGGFALTPLEVEFWCAGDSRLHDRFLWTRETIACNWRISRLYP